MNKLFVLFVMLMASTAVTGQETLKIDWPSDYNWQLISNHEDEKLQILEIIPKNQTKEDWSLLGQMMVKLQL